ncbi:hypothetical protein BO94DRAFT_164760 [Aspergillus sclerotioniger CBS 115572]|uniref:Uncharacterized protein n=1 Tax=Aspergillus sclerotioniger CBS 115572 TaxID=1450535 RepID=A0A317W2E6_9EURO|nr:hypothetical protein BO94DRAFT_164760 [Aspergillus sclerotioniger CBS 115572]PWY79358.1 hypothetical protein BO94DRAFT_164760 [Aspergillus sclerotioniger CBS 115572]
MQTSVIRDFVRVFAPATDRKRETGGASRGVEHHRTMARPIPLPFNVMSYIEGDEQRRKPSKKKGRKRKMEMTKRKKKRKQERKRKKKGTREEKEKKRQRKNRTAQQAIASNAWNPYLTTIRDGTRRGICPGDTRPQQARKGAMKK